MNLQFIEKMYVNKQLKSAEFFIRSENFEKKIYLVTNFGTRRLFKSIKF